ncbi:MAG TPA: hypothetical protein VKF82_08585 [Candidatus Eremiobacteraceae bacterium]|nr:hypothetical protein [Candidatus Eremiobacteraceae bacterium]
MVMDDGEMDEIRLAINDIQRSRAEVLEFAYLRLGKTLEGALADADAKLRELIAKWRVRK